MSVSPTSLSGYLSSTQIEETTTFVMEKTNPLSSINLGLFLKLVKTGSKVSL